MDLADLESHLCYILAGEDLKALKNRLGHIMEKL